MLQKLRAIALALTLAASVAVPTATLAHTEDPLHYNAACSTGNTSYNPRAHVGRNGTYKKVRGEYIVRNLYPCTSPSSTANGWSIVAVANAQSATSFVQLGVAQQACSTNCQNGFVNGVKDFWYTAEDDWSPGGVISAAKWVDFNGDGQHDYPQVGVEYRFTIELTEHLSVPSWKLTIATTSGSQSDYKYIDRTGGYFTTAWWGFETYNDASVLGSRASDPNAYITPMQYMNSTGSIYSTVNGQSTCSWVVTGPYPAPGHWSSQVCQVYDQASTGNGIIKVFTNQHD
jgi:hypothetical protein